VVLAYAVVTPASRDLDAMALVVMGIMGVFFLDLGATIVRRRINGRPLFAGDRSHLYDQLRERGWPVPRIAVFAAAVQGVFAAVFLGLLAAGGGIGVATASIGLTVAVSVLLMWRFGFLRRTSN
jgi:UDP-N-acetylmuramyl pentapeptide phosphotransferase/UDP-N-acetylglucosamine-1-phosphate transferase